MNKTALDTAFWTYCKATGINPESHPAIEEAIRQSIEAYELAKPPAAEWQAIETAPRDGTRFIGGQYNCKGYFAWNICLYINRHTVSADWDEKYGEEGTDGEWYAPEGFHREGQSAYGDEYYYPIKPTHWVQITSLPKIEPHPPQTESPKS